MDMVIMIIENSWSFMLSGKQVSNILTAGSLHLGFSPGGGGGDRSFIIGARVEDYVSSGHDKHGIVVASIRTSSALRLHVKFWNIVGLDVGIRCKARYM